MSFCLAPEHIRAASRARRSILLYDARNVAVECGGLKAPEGLSLLDAYRLRLWNYIDRCIGQVDSICWDAFFSDQIAFCRRSALPEENERTFAQLWESGVDIYDEYIAGCRRRGIECLLSHRIGGPDVGGRDRLKDEHPEYYINDWTQMTNLAVPEMRDYKLSVFREILDGYDFDGYCVDFCRHTPFLEPGRQWELRAHVTQFLRDLRTLTLDYEQKWGHPILLTARVPESADGCRQDGLDVAAWAEERLVDSLIIGSRSFEVDVDSIRSATGSAVKLYPCFDAHHQTDAYADPPADVLNAVFANWWAQGADGVALFNLYACDWETYQKTAAAPFQIHAHPLEQILPVAGDESLLAPLDKTFVVERRGGYPWGNGFANENSQKQLPRILANSGAPESVFLFVCDPIAHRAERVESLFLDVQVYGAQPADRLVIALNGVEICGAAAADYADRQICPLQSEYVSGYHTAFLPERAERFTRVRCALEPGLIVRGRNVVSVRILRAPGYPVLSQAELERVELAVRYR